MTDSGMYVLLSLLVEGALAIQALRYFRNKTDVEAVGLLGLMTMVSVFPVNALTEDISPWVYRLLLCVGLLLMFIAYVVLGFFRHMRGGQSAREKKAAARL